MTKKLFEITAVGFDASTDETDDRVLWVEAESIEQVKESIGYAKTTGIILELPFDSLEYDTVDFILPQQAGPMRRVLNRFAANPPVKHL